MSFPSVVEVIEGIVKSTATFNTQEEAIVRFKEIHHEIFDHNLTDPEEANHLSTALDDGYFFTGDYSCCFTDIEPPKEDDPLVEWLEAQGLGAADVQSEAIQRLHEREHALEKEGFEAQLAFLVAEMGGEEDVKEMFRSVYSIKEDFPTT